MRTLLFTALLLCACGDDTTEDTATATDDTGTTATDDSGVTDTAPEPVDEDGDGVLSDRDCDDADPANFPGNVEVCDGADNDCDSVADDDPYDISTWYLDADEDGYGDADSALEACDQPSGYVSNTSDCDDLDASVFPGATEICDGVDQDCDDDIDEDVSGEDVTWYADADTDGYGSPHYTTEACTQPGGFVYNYDDCDDLDGSSYPGAPETCDDADNDCDGEIDEDGPSGSSTWYIDYDGDGYGSDSFTDEACDQPEGWVDNTDDCDDTDADVHPGATEACNEVDDDCDDEVDEDASLDLDTWYADSDGDGYGDADSTTEACTQPSDHVTNDDDCDDDDADIYPGAPESCDGVDEDCDGDVDNDASDGDTWWIDLDGDGYGNSILTASDCEQPAGYVDNSDDCDDLEADAWPDNTEVCDGIDNDCDEETDESDASDASTWYADSDGDGYGDPDTSETACEAPTDYVSDDSDCDDADATINPSALEQCDSVDNDCDTEVDEDEAIDVVTWYQDADGDGYGESTVSEDHCDAPTGYVSDDTDCDDSEALANPGETETCNDGIDNDCDGSASGCQISGSVAVSKADADWYGETSSNYVGCDVSFIGDVDADGYDDMLLGAYGNDDNGSYSGSAYLIYGDPTLGSTYAVSSEIQLYGESSDDYAGWSVHGGQDVNNDGYDDALVGAIYSDDYTTNAGSVYLLYGPLPTSSTVLYNADAEYYGEASSDYAGHSVVLPGDIDADGYADVLYGAYANDDGGSNSGSVYLFHGPPGSYDQYGYNADRQYVGENSSDYAGYRVAYAGDIDDDGFDDVWIGAYAEDTGGSNAGAAYLVYGDTGTGNVDLSSADAKLIGEYDSDYASWSMASGDLNDDGQRDLVVGAMYSDEGGNDSGMVYVIQSPPSGTYDLGGAETQVVGERSGTYSGCDVAVADIDNDDVDDLVIGSFGVSSSAGAVYIVYGPVEGLVDLSSADAEVRGSGSSDYLGWAVDAGGDVDGDGVGDVLMGAQYDDDNGGESGTAWLFYGTGM